MILHYLIIGTVGLFFILFGAVLAFIGLVSAIFSIIRRRITSRGAKEETETTVGE